MTWHTATYDALTSLSSTVDDVRQWAEGCDVELISNSSQGEVRWSVREFNGVNCGLLLQVSPHLYLQARVRLNGHMTCFEVLNLYQFTDNNKEYEIIIVYPSRQQTPPALGQMHCGNSPYFQVLFSPHNQMYFSMRVPADVTVSFTTSPQFLKNTLPFVMLTAWQGYLTSPGYDGLCISSPWVDSSRTVTVPADFVAMMVSFERLALGKISDGTCLDLYYVERNSAQTQKRLCHQRLPEVLRIYSLSLKFRVTNHLNILGFKLLFSFHKNSTIPSQNVNGQFNCQVNFYGTFSRHLHCNNRAECENGRDETGRCPFSSELCQGKVASGNKCLFAVFQRDAEDDMSHQCQSEGGELAVIQSRAEQDDVYRLLEFHDHCTDYTTGLVYHPKTTPNLYKQMWTGIDRSTVYTVFRFLETKGRIIPQQPFILNEQMLFINLRPRYLLSDIPSLMDLVQKDEPCGAVCQRFSIPYTENRSISFNNTPSQNCTTHAGLTYSHETLALAVCPKEFLTHVFLTCNVCDKKLFVDKCYFSRSLGTKSLSVDAEAGSQNPQGEHSSGQSQAFNNRWETTPDQMFVHMFICDDNNGTIHYTNVCDLRKDCHDGSDETFCRHSTSCEQFTCGNGQCVAFYSVCDSVFDCHQDNSDETLCYNEDTVIIYEFRQNIELADPSIINYDGRGYFTHSPIDATDPCPFTHYRCPGPPHHCLPVYTRCNDFYDCAGREDENDCDDPQCPGYFRCRESPVCLHPEHLCDGWRQCPEGDDELLCGEKLCPAGCMCQGLAFVCSHPFDALHFPHIKYLDGSGSHLTPADLRSNQDLVYLSFRDCGLQSVSSVSFPNLRHLDLSHNNLHNLSMNVFLNLQNVRFLSLAHNPLFAVYSQHSVQKQKTLKQVDLSFTELRSFNTEPFSNFLSLQRLNLSWAGVGTIMSGGFQHIPSLIELDLSGCPVQYFPSDMFQGLSKLQEVRADVFKVCCPSILPPHFDDHFCLAPQDEISSCEDLVRSETYRGLLWLMSFLSVFGNGFCLVFRLLVQRKNSKKSFKMFVSNLSVADFIMGVYLAMIGIADSSYRGIYLHHDVTWTRSAACQAAGFLSLLSNQVSSFTIALITLDRFTVLRFPFSNVRFGRRSTLFALTSTWIVGFVLAVVPLLPVTSHWYFYSQTGICIPLPITRTDFAGRSYSFGVVVVVNFVLFLLIAGGQAIIYDSVRQNSMDWHNASSKSKVKDATVTRRLVTVAVTNFLCWFPIGLCGVLSSFGIPVPGEINVAAAILILPLNSALNPFLYTLNVAIEIRRRAARDRLWEMLLNTLNKE